jgi:hypothetical protein
MSMATIEDMERRIADLEDRLAILQLLASYGPAVDSLDRDGVAALWAADGRYDFGGDPLNGREAVASLIDLDTHRSYVAKGSSHILSLPRIEIDGDRAVAVNYSQVFIRDPSAPRAGWHADRSSANRWELVKTADGWQVSARTNRLLDGTQPARDLLRRE